MKELIYHRLLLPAVKKHAERPFATNASSGFATTYAQHLDRVGDPRSDAAVGEPVVAVSEDHTEGG